MQTETLIRPDKPFAIMQGMGNGRPVIAALVNLQEVETELEKYREENPGTEFWLQSRTLQ